MWYSWNPGSGTLHLGWRVRSSWLLQQAGVVGLQVHGAEGICKGRQGGTRPGDGELALCSGAQLAQLQPAVTGSFL